LRVIEKIQGQIMNELYKTQNYPGSLLEQLNLDLTPVGPYNSSVSNAIRPALAPETGLWDSLTSSLQSPGFYQGAGQFMGGLGSLGNMALGFKGLGLLEDQLDLQRNQWNESKAELDTMRQARNKLNTQYLG
jgi:hypothetical protein